MPACPTKGEETQFCMGIPLPKPELDDMIKFHKPHPSQIMKQCYLREIEQQLRVKGVIK